jgi:NhaP-type Na+/H+ and K+/H+ antiporter
MLAPISLILIITLSILITRIAAIALVHTGVSRELAKFQARSAFTGAGFTTEESENMVNHPVRRRIIMWLMFLGNAGIVTGITSLILTFVGREEDASMWFQVAAIGGGLALLWFMSLSDWVDRHLSNAVSSLLDRYTELQVRDYASLMHLTDEYRLVDMLLEHDDWVVGRKLGNTRLRDEGIVVLAIERSNDTFLGTPQGDTELKEGDRMIVYGRVEALQRLDERRKGFTGQVSHEEAVAEQDKVVEEEERKDQADDEDDGGEDAAEQRDDG